VIQIFLIFRLLQLVSHTQYQFLGLINAVCLFISNVSVKIIVAIFS